MTTERARDASKHEDAGGHERAARARRVVVLLHGGEERASAIMFARLLAHTLGVPLHGLFAHSKAIPAAEALRMLGLDEDALESVVLDVEVGDPAERLVLRAAREPDTLFVVPAPPETAAPDPLALGRLASRVLTAAESVAGVILIRGGTSPSPRLVRILVPLDGTPSTARAVTPAGYIARRAAADLDIVYVGIAGEDVHQPAREPGSMTAPQYVDQPHHEWAAFSDEFLHRFLNALAHCAPDVNAHMFLGAGDPATEILRWADQLGTDLIVLAWHGQLDHAHADDEPPPSSVRPRAHGGIVRDVLRGAQCPVLVLRT